MKRGLVFSALAVFLLLVIFLLGLHLLVVEYDRGVKELARRKGEAMAREVAVNMGHLVEERMNTVALLSSTFFPFYLEGKISREDLDRAVALHMEYGGGVTNVQFFNGRGEVVLGYPRDRAMRGLELSRDLKSGEFFRLFKRCLVERGREVKVIRTLFLDPYSMSLIRRPILVAMYPVSTHPGERVRGVLMATLDLSRLVKESFGGPLLAGWGLALLGDEGEVLWKGGEVGGSSFLEGRGKAVRVEVPFRVGDKRWQVVAEVPRSRVEGGVISFYRKVEVLICAFLLVLGLSLFSAFREIKKGYRALASSEDRFRTLVEGMMEVFYVRDGEGNLSYISPGAQDKLGVPEGVLREALLSFPPSRVEMTLELGDRILSVREREKEGAFYGLVGDITRERRLGREVERERRFLDRIVSGLGAGVMVLDEEMRVLWMNTYLKEMFGLGGNPEGAFCYTLFAQRMSPCPSCHMEPVLRGEEKEGEGMRRYRVPLFGEDRDFFWKVQRVRVEDRERIVVICQDITETRRMEEKVYFMDKLSSLGKLAASVAHELSTPLFVTSTNLDMVLRKERLSPSARRLLEVSADELRRSALLLQRLRWIYRPISMEKEEVHVERVLKDVAAIMRAYARERKVGLNLEIAPVSPFMGYKGPLMQVLLNLVTNAVEVSPPGGEVTLRAEGEGEELILTIRDRGGGIPGEVMKRLFEPFVTDKGERGAGLGLHISYKLVEGMGGTIEVESHQGEGTTFRVRLPMGEGGEK